MIQLRNSDRLLLESSIDLDICEIDVETSPIDRIFQKCSEKGKVNFNDNNRIKRNVVLTTLESAEEKI